MITASVEQAPANSSDLIVYVSISLFLFLVDGVSHLDFFNSNYPGSRTSLKLTGSILVRRFLSLTASFSLCAHLIDLLV